MQQLVPYCLKGACFRVSETRAVHELTLQLLQLLDQVMLIEGRSPSFLVFAAAFVAWKSLDRSRVHCSFSDFQRETRVRANLRSAQTLSKQLEEKLVELSLGLPWIKLKRRCDVTLHVKDILCFSQSLVSDHRQRQERGRTVEDATSAVQASSREAEAEDGDREISDAEIDKYIRSRAEVQAVLRLTNATMSRPSTGL